MKGSVLVERRSLGDLRSVIHPGRRGEAFEQRERRRMGLPERTKPTAPGPRLDARRLLDMGYSEELAREIAEDHEGLRAAMRKAGALTKECRRKGSTNER
jgi:hypothetical protein